MDGGIKHVWGDVKAHPYISAGAVFVAGAVLIYLYYGTATPATPARSTSNPAAAALTNEALQQNYAAQIGAQQAQLQSVAAQVNGAVAISGNQKDVALAGIANQGTIDLAQLSAQRDLGLADINARESIALGSIAAIVNLASIDATARAQSDAALYGYLGTQVADQFAYLTLQTNNNKDIQALGIAADVAKASNLNAQTVNAIEGQIGQLGTAVTSQGNAITTIGNVVAQNKNAQDAFDIAVQNTIRLPNSAYSQGAP